MTGTQTEGYWEGALWVYHADIVNNGANSGNQVYSIVPGVGNELEVLYGTVFNGDAAGRSTTVIIDDGTNNLSLMVSETLGSAASRDFPSSNTSRGAAGQRYILAGTMRLITTVASVAVSQDSRLGLCCRIRGDLPTVTLTSPTGATETVNRNQVF